MTNLVYSAVTAIGSVVTVSSLFGLGALVGALAVYMR